MCTAINFKTKDSYFGRTLDLDCSYGEQICVLPRNFPMRLRSVGEVKQHYAIIGMAAVVSGTPLFYDAVNEHGLAMAGLNFPDNAHYGNDATGEHNIPQFELIPLILGSCKNLEEAREALEKISISAEGFSEKLPPTPQHWIISHGAGSLAAEPMADGLHIYENPVGVMTNSPPLPYQLFNLNNYRGLCRENGKNTFSEALLLSEYCQGLGALGLPGDVSSMSRFVRAAFNKENSVCDSDEESSVSQFFHILGSVQMCRGACRLPSGKYDISVYTSCMNTDRGIYYYKTYGNSRISAVDMRKTDLDGFEMKVFPLILKEQIYRQN